MIRPAVVVRVALWTWFAGAVAMGITPGLRPASASHSALVLGLTALALYPYFRVGKLRDFVDGLDPRALLQIHLCRLLGIFFILQWWRGGLPYAFAVPVGIGEIVVAACALVLIVGKFESSQFRRYLTLWNVVGLFDLLFAVYIAAKVGTSNPKGMRAFDAAPLWIWPSFLVPLLLATHVMLFARLLRR